MAKKEKKIVIDHVENARLIKELQSEDWKIVRGMERFLLAFIKAANNNSEQTIQQFSNQYLKGVYDLEQYENLNSKRQSYRDAVYNQKDVQRLQQKVGQLQNEKEKLIAQIEYYDKASSLELPVPFGAEQHKQKVERLSEIAKELEKFE